ncbi:hypothetical protein, partial [Enterococcus faecalis]|uniref:hypothetical protein n=1 Tax=Enterococcus faecalis TaxID=1351 RepID=UPI00156169BC
FASTILEVSLTFADVKISTASTVALLGTNSFAFARSFICALKIISGPNSGEKTDASGDDQAEYDETNKQIIVRVGNDATAT